MKRETDGRNVDGVRITARPRRGGVRAAVGLAVLVLLAGAVLTAWREADPPASSVDASPPQSPSASDAGDASDAQAPRARARQAAASERANGQGAARAGEDPTPDLSDYILPGEAPDMAQVIDALHARGIRTGLGAFQPPGTRPPLRGLEVPENFPLPEGYVRHFQATDDGQRIAPILMFAPDLDWVTVRGVRVRVPANRVVPPELAPAGLPLRWVRIPAPVDGRGRG